MKTDGKTSGGQKYIPYQQWPEYKVVNDIPHHFKPEAVTYGAVIGARWHFGPFHLEECVTDDEPRATENHQRRVVFWQRIHRLDVPKGWHQGFFAKSPVRIGYTLIGRVDYFNDWPETTRYYRRKWIKDLLGKKYTIERAGLDEYKDAYLQSSVVKKVGLRQIAKLERKMKVASEHLDLWVVQRVRDKKIVAGLGVINSPTYHSSNHFSAFMHEDAKKDRVSLALVDHWFKQSIKNNITLLDFGIFWQKGDPNSWKGFSQFKGQFNVTFISLPPRLFKLKKKQ